MKKGIIGLAVLFAAVTCFGVKVDEGMLELRLQGKMDFDNKDGHVETEAGLGLGYFLFDDLVVGGTLNFDNKGSDAGLGFGGYVERIFDLHYPVAPFIGASAQVRFGDVYLHDHLMVEFNGGVKVFIMEYLAISGMIFVDLATDKVFINYDKACNHDAGLRLGLNVYY